MYLSYSTPEEQGIDSMDILRFLDTVEQEHILLDSLMIVKNAAIVCEAYWAPFKRTEKHLLQSVSKSFTSMAVGILINEEKLKLSDKMVNFFPSYVGKDCNERVKHITVRDLLTMTASNAKTPAIFTRLTSSWIENYFTMPPAHEPGSYFQYDTGAAILLSAIVSCVAQKSVHDILKERVFLPMGIESSRWSYLPEKTEGAQGVPISFGGCGLSMSVPDLAKFAQMLLNMGKYDDMQVLPASWIREATSKQINNVHSDLVQTGPDGYGYLIWLGPNGTYMFYGSYGQYMIFDPRHQMFVITTGSCRMDQDPRLKDLLYEYFINKSGRGILPPNKSLHTALRRRVAALTLQPPQGEPVSPVEKEYLGRQYVFWGNNYRNLRAICVRRADETTLCIDMDILYKKITVLADFGSFRDNQVILPRDIEYNAILKGNDNHTQAYAYAWQDEHTLKLTHSVVNSLSVDYYTLRFDKDGVQVHIEQNAYYDNTREETFYSLP